MPLYWKVVLVNGAVFCAGTAALVLSPASVSQDPLVSELVVLTLGLAAMLLVNAALLRASLGPVDRVVREMRVLESPGGGRRLGDAGGAGPGAVLVRSWNGMLDRLEAERASSSQRALAAQEAERHRIAQDLHDQVGQSLTVVLLGLKQVEGLAPPGLVEELALVRDSARAGLDDVRRVARQLRPGVLDDLGLHSALAALATEFSAAGRHVRRSVAPGLPDLTPEIELVLYRVAQEALTNVARHAGASQVEVSLGRVGDAVVLEVADDGVGTRDSPPGTGLAGMRERALLVGGRLSVEGREGRGTTVRLAVPLP
ncbi:sensor histidine kinase [Nocardioides dongxiaopingii]|uniref:sensor histidine kinase n=1 Tax=Nocardioides TaxID=1839 RepID=UPI0010C7708C|nr:MULTISPECIES: sensor histidine kinase [Nocardioides]QCW50315.1 sensor histidine kinase [Nocardioides sp. S-1144]